MLSKLVLTVSDASGGYAGGYQQGGLKKPMLINQLRGLLADRGGFEPPIRYERIHAFQACAFNRSATCPKRVREALTTQGLKFNRDWLIKYFGLVSAVLRRSFVLQDALHVACNGVDF